MDSFFSVLIPLALASLIMVLAYALSEYSAFADVKQYGKIATGRDSGTVIKSYRLTGMFPIDISPIDLAWSSNDQLEEFQVTFALQHWESATSVAS